MAGSLVVLARQSPLNGGTTVPGAQLFVYDAGTTTKRAIYTTSALSVEHDNPVDADANGRFPAVWIDPDSGSYKSVLAPQGDTDPPASPFWTDDNIPVLGSAYSEGEFTAALTGMDASLQGTMTYRISANAAGTGKVCVLIAQLAIAGTSNATSMTLTGLPAACTPSSAVLVPVIVTDSSAAVQGAAQISASGTTITFSCDTPLSTTGFTGSGTKGLSAGWTMVYAL